MNEPEKEIIIKLKDWHIPHLLGAIRLGITLEDWCSDAFFIETCSSDSQTPHWQSVVVGAKQEIIKQSGIDKERFAHARDKQLESLAKVLYREFEKWQRTCLIREAEEMEKEARR